MNSKHLKKVLPLLTLLQLFFYQAHSQSFTELNQTFAATYYGAAVWADYDKDGHLDFFVNGWMSTGGSTSAPSAFLYHNNGNGTFSEISNSILPLGACTAAWGDINNDGYPDLAISGNSGNNVYAAKIYRNNGDGTFTDMQAAIIPVISPFIVFDDMNNDGFQDIIIVGAISGGDSQTSVYINNGNETFSEITTTIVNVSSAAVATGDLNNDGWSDIVIAGRITSSDYVSKVYLNQGDAVFSEMTVPFDGARYASISLADYSGDGFMDILIAGSNNDGLLQTRLYKNSNGTDFTFVPTPLTGIIQGSVAWGDMNNDGLLDVLLTGSDVSTGATRVTEIFINQGNDVFTKNLEYSFPGLRRSTAQWGDYNSDGKLDVLATGYFQVSNYITKIFTNNTATQNTPPLPPSGLESAVSGGSATLSWLAGSDLQTADASLTYNLRIGTTPGGTEIVTPLSDPSTGTLFIPKNGNAGLNKSTQILDLDEGTYYWSVQSVDGAFEGSTFANEQVFIVSNQLTATFQVTSDGQALQGATVQVGSQQKVTDSGGIAVFNMSPGTFNYTVSHPFHITQTGNFSISDQSIVIPIALVQLPTFQLSFTLNGTSGPIEGAQIEVNGQNLTTNNAGFASLTVLEGQYPYYIYAADYNQIWGVANVASNTNLTPNMVQIALFELPFSELFETNLLPLHWLKFDESESGNTWLFTNGRAIIDSDAAGSGVNVHASLVTPPVNTSALTGGVKLKFKHFFNRLGQNNYARVHYSADNGPWVQLAEFNTIMGTIDNFVQTELIVEGVGGQVNQLRFRFEYDDGLHWSEQWMIEEVMITEYNLQPYEMTISNVKQPAYAKTPIRHFEPFSFSATGKNTGLNALENVSLSVSSNQNPVASSTPLTFFPPSAQAIFVTEPAFVPQIAGDYFFTHQFIAPGINLTGPTNNYSLKVSVSDTVFATEDGGIIGGVGGSEAISFGNLYQLQVFDQFRSFTIGWNDITTSQSFTVSLFSVNMADSTLVQELYTSPTIVREPSMAQQYITFALANPITLNAGYYVLLVNQLDNNSIAVGYNGVANGLFWRKSGEKIVTFLNTQWGNIAVRMNVHDPGVSLSETSSDDSFLLYPNPANSQIQIQYFGKTVSKLSIVDISGRLITSHEINQGHNTIDISRLQKGIYFVNIDQLSKKLIINR